MANNIFIVPEKDWEIIRKYISSRNAVVLIHEDTAKKVGVAQDMLNDSSDYDFGGEADVMLDLVTNKDHYFFTHLKEDDILKKEDDNE